MSFLDKIQPNLNALIFDKNLNMRDDFRSTVMEYIDNIFGKNIYSRVLLLGSMAGYQYNDSSDIDLNIILKKNEDREKFHKFKKTLDTVYYKNTKHEVTFFFQKYIDAPTFEDAIYPIYDISQNKWLVKPQKILYDPEKKFYRHIYFANKVIQTLLRLYDKYELNKKKLSRVSTNSRKYRSIKKEIGRDIERLVAQHRKIDKDRKIAYYGGWGIPRESQQNIIYKLYEYNRISKILEDLNKQFGDEEPNII